jgi:hypothetical protein
VQWNSVPLFASALLTLAFYLESGLLPTHARVHRDARMVSPLAVGLVLPAMEVLLQADFAYFQALREQREARSSDRSDSETEAWPP